MCIYLNKRQPETYIQTNTQTDKQTSAKRKMFVRYNVLLQGYIYIQAVFK